MAFARARRSPTRTACASAPTDLAALPRAGEGDERFTVRCWPKRRSSRADRRMGIVCRPFADELQHAPRRLRDLRAGAEHRLHAGALEERVVALGDDAADGDDDVVGAEAFELGD